MVRCDAGVTSVASTEPSFVEQGGIFALITPIGIAIGIAVHSGYNPNSGAALLSIGVLDAISAGILIYAGIIEMLYHDVSISLVSVDDPSR